MKKISLGSILHMTKGKKPKVSAVKQETGYQPYVDIKAFEKGIINNFASPEKCLLCQNGDILIVCDGARSGLVGRAMAGIVGSTLALISADGCSNDYLFYFLQSLYILLNTKQKGTGTPHLNPDILKKAQLVVPPLPEQERIVAKIEELFSQLDAAVTELKSVKEKLAIYRQAVLKDAFEGKLTEKWRILHHKNNEWCVFNIKNIVQKGQNSLKAGPFGSALKKSCYVPSGYKVYGQEQVIADNENIGDYYISEEKYQELISCKIQPYDILISLVGTVGKVLILSTKCEPGVINPRLIKVSLDQKKMLPEFFKYYFTSNYLKSLYKQQVHGATMDVLNMGMIKELPFQWCPIDEQRQVISEIETRISICNNIEQNVDTALQQAAALRQSILKQAFEGDL